MIEGEYFGTGNIEGIDLFVQNGNEVLSKKNRIGLAVDEHSLFIAKKNENIVS